MDLRRIAMIMVQALLVAGVAGAEIKCYPLDERAVYTVRLSQHEPTTCVFPGALKALVGANVSTKPEDDPGVLLSHEPGTEYFSLRALKENATGALNLIYRGRVYALAFITAPEPDRAVVFLDEPGAAAGAHQPSAESLHALIEHAKQLDRGPSPYPAMASSLAIARPGNPTPYRAFTATIESIVRFDAEDALVFHIRLENTLDVPVLYDPQGLAVRLDREIFPAVLTEASGAIPPRSVSHIYLVISGAPGGGRANLSVHGKFTVIVPHP